jgi:hypothetical protein
LSDLTELEIKKLKLINDQIDPDILNGENVEIHITIKKKKIVWSLFVGRDIFYKL